MKVRVTATALIISLMATLAGCSGGKTADADSGGRSRHVSVVAFLGDSYTVGVGETTRDQTYASVTARKLGWQVLVAGQAGTGLLAPGREGNPYGRLYEQQLAWRPAPDLAVIVGGHNDWPYPPSLEETTATRLMDQMRQRWPRTHVLMLGPMWGSGEPRTEVLGVRDALRTAAKQSHVPFIDPLAERWVTGSRESGTGNAPRYVLKDSTHPNKAGHRYFASRLVADLRKLGLTQPVLGQSSRHLTAGG